MRRLQSVIQILCLSLWPSLAIAQVTMQVQLGLQGTVRLEKWNPVTIHLYNTGPPVVGTLGVRVWHGSEFRRGSLGCFRSSPHERRAAGNHLCPYPLFQTGRAHE